MNNLFDKILGKRLKDARKKCNYTMENVYKILGISRQSLINYENGKGNPTLKTIINICTLYKITPNYLVYGDDDNFNKISSSLKRKVYFLASLDSDNDISYDYINKTISFNNPDLRKYYSYCHSMFTSSKNFSKLEIIDKILQYIDSEIESQ